MQKPLRAGEREPIEHLPLHGPKGSGSDFDGTLRATKSASFLFLRPNPVKVDLSYNPLLELLKVLSEGGNLNHTSIATVRLIFWKPSYRVSKALSEKPVPTLPAKRSPSGL
jgi:hypothetical protein